MASSSADWVLGGVRLISSASTRLANTGPGRNTRSVPLGVALGIRQSHRVSASRELRAVEVGGRARGAVGTWYRARFDAFTHACSDDLERGIGPPGARERRSHRVDLGGTRWWQGAARVF